MVWQSRIGDATVSKTWYDSGWDLGDAADWQAAGFSARESDEIRGMIVTAALADSPPIDDPAAWRASGLPPARIVACLDAGVRTAQGARRLYTARQS